MRSPQRHRDKGVADGEKRRPDAWRLSRRERAESRRPQGVGHRQSAREAIVESLDERHYSLVADSPIRRHDRPRAGLKQRRGQPLHAFAAHQNAAGGTTRRQHDEIGVQRKRGEVAGSDESIVFIGILVVGFYYAWRKGALEWV